MLTGGYDWGMATMGGTSAMLRVLAAACRDDLRGQKGGPGRSAKEDPYRENHRKMVIYLDFNGISWDIPSGNA